MYEANGTITDVLPPSLILYKGILILTLLMLRLLWPKHKDVKIFEKTSKPYHVGIHWIALTECSRVSTHVPGFQSFFFFVLAELATTSIRVKVYVDTGSKVISTCFGKYCI